MGPMQPIHKETVARLLKYIVPFWPRWWYGCEPYQIGCATVQPVAFATCSQSLVSR